MKTATILMDSLKQEVQDKRAIAMVAIYLVILSIGLKAGPMLGRVARLIFIETSMPAEVIVLYYMSAALAPMLAILLSYDSISGETSTHTMSFLVTRSSRHSIFLGKWLASAIIISAVNLAAHAFASAYFMIRTGDAYLSGVGLSWFYATILSITFISIGYFCSTITRKHQTALWATVSIATINLLMSTKDILPKLSPYSYIAHPLEGDITTGTIALTIMTAAWLAASIIIFKRKDI